MSLPQLALILLLAHAACGLIFAAAFVTIGVPRLDQACASTPLRVRLLFIPASAALWPFLLHKWATTPKPAQAPTSAEP